jgi:hypothetical protein
MGEMMHFFSRNLTKTKVFPEGKKATWPLDKPHVHVSSFTRKKAALKRQLLPWKRLLDSAHVT